MAAQLERPLRRLSEALRQPRLLALLCLLAIPALLTAGGAVFGAIDPERLARRSHYSSDFELVQHLRTGVLLATLVLCVLAWFASCFFLLRAKRRSARWLPLALFGPFGLVALVCLRDGDADAPEAAPSPRLAGLSVALRVLLETGIFVVFASAAFGVMEAKRDVSIAWEAARTGMSRDEVIELRDADGGMWAFSEGNEVLFFFALFYLLRALGEGAYRARRRQRAARNLDESRGDGPAA